MNGLYVAIGVVVLLALATAFSYNRFVNQKNLIGNSWSNIDTELTRRYDLIPNLVETVKGYAAHERAVFERVTEARSAAISATGPPSLQETAERPLVAAVRNLMAVAENYPNLKASEHFLDLERQLTLTEDRLQAARRFYNANVQEYNRRVRSIPSRFVAAMFGFHAADYFHIDPAVRSEVAMAPPVSLDGS
ncbi:MAG: LemA protein [Actinomycetota bacterium]|nr:LemA protein [Actinomycetota bacterium]